jgi:antitoxin ParD1/3/4
MPSRNISLTPRQDAFIDRMVRSGTYQNASEAVRCAC